eukprot:11715477-Karenia_brevis.AAC.1
MVDEKKAALMKHVAHEEMAAQQASPLQPVIHFPKVETFTDFFREAAWRRPMLVIIGSTNTGKSELAKVVLQKVGKVLGLSEHLELTVETDNLLDLSQFDVTRHAGVVLDGVRNVEFLIENRESLQGRPKITYGGKSQT